jgi:hypothetical protein
VSVAITYYNTGVSRGGSDTSTSDPADTRLWHRTIAGALAALTSARLDRRRPMTGGCPARAEVVVVTYYITRI